MGCPARTLKWVTYDVQVTQAADPCRERHSEGKGFETGKRQEGSRMEQIASHDDVKRILGPMDDGKCVAIIASGATIKDLEEVAAWLADEDDVMGELERPLTGVARQVYELLTADQKFDEEP